MHTSHYHLSCYLHDFHFIKFNLKHPRTIMFSTDNFLADHGIPFQSKQFCAERANWIGSIVVAILKRNVVRSRNSVESDERSTNERISVRLATKSQTTEKSPTCGFGKTSTINIDFRFECGVQIANKNSKDLFLFESIIPISYFENWFNL